MSEPGSTTAASTVTGTAAPMAFRPPHVVIVGAGFAGLAAARSLAWRWWRRRVRVTVIDQHNHHTFTPFLYQVATALLEPSGAAHPVRALIRKLGGVDFRLGRVTTIDVTRRTVQTDHGSLRYDYLILAAGAVNDYHAHASIAARSFGLADLGEALALRNHLLACFEAAAWDTDPARRARLLTFAVAGGGPTGVEFAAALAVLVRQLATRDFRGMDTREIRIVLAEGSSAPLPSFPADLRDAAARALRAKGVEVVSGVTVTNVDDMGLLLGNGQRIDAATVVWAAGVRASPLAGVLPATGSHCRVIVHRTLQVERHPEIFVAGDMAEIPGRAGPLPMLAQVAIQSGRHAARSVLRMLAGKPARRFRYRDLGTMAAVGRGDAVAQIGDLHLSGLQGWLAWLGVHIVRTVGLQARATVVLDWVSGYVFADRPVRLITGPARADGDTAPGAAGPEPATARVPMRRARMDLPSVNVANANRWGRMAALAWWGQDYPGLRQDPPKLRGRRGRRARAQRLRLELTGDKSQTHDNYRG